MLDDQVEVDRLLDWLDSHLVGHIPSVLHAEGQRIRARLLAARGDPGSVRALEAATQAFRNLGSPYHLAVGLLDHAEHLTAIGDAQSAEPLVAEAQTIAQGLGAKPLLERVHRLMGPVRDLVEGVDRAT